MTLKDVSCALSNLMDPMEPAKSMTQLTFPHTIFTGGITLELPLYNGSMQMTVTVRPALGRWVVKFTWSGVRMADRTAVWISGKGWNRTQWNPVTTLIPLPPEAVTQIEDWLRTHPVPVPGAGEADEYSP